jgi:hypothetical protein
VDTAPSATIRRFERSGPGAGMFPELLQPLRVALPEIHQCGEGGQGLGFQVVFDVLDLDLDGFGFEPHEAEEFGEGPMPVADVLGDGATFRGEGEAAVTLVIDETAFGQATHHVGDGGSTQSKGFGEVTDPGIPEAIDQFLDPLKVILGRFRSGDGGVTAQAGHRTMVAGSWESVEASDPFPVGWGL